MHSLQLSPEAQGRELVQGEVKVVQGEQGWCEGCDCCRVWSWWRGWGWAVKATSPSRSDSWECLEGWDQVGASLPPLGQPFLTHQKHEMYV